MKRITFFARLVLGWRARCCWSISWAAVKVASSACGSGAGVPCAPAAPAIALTQEASISLASDRVMVLKSFSRCRGTGIFGGALGSSGP